VTLTVTVGVNPDMKLPDVERAEQLKAKEANTASNPFAAVAKRKKKEKIDQPVMS
jgi:hypothetical protein